MDILGLVVVSNDSSKLLLVLGNSSFNLLHANDFFALLLVSSLLESLHLFVNKVNNLILVVVSESENLLIISSFVVKLDVLLFKCKQGSSDFVDEVEQCVILQTDVHFFVLFLQGSESLLTDDITFNILESSVDEQTSLVKTDFKGSDDSLVEMSLLKNNFLVDLIASVVQASLNEDDFVNVIQLVENCGSSWVVNWFKLLKNSDHEVLVVKVLPGVECILVRALSISESEVISETLQEVLEQKVRVNFSLNLKWKLAHNGLIVISGNCVVLVVRPSVLHEILNLNFHVMVNASSLVELFKVTKES